LEKVDKVWGLNSADKGYATIIDRKEANKLKHASIGYRYATKQKWKKEIKTYYFKKKSLKTVSTMPRIIFRKLKEKRKYEDI